MGTVSTYQIWLKLELYLRKNVINKNCWIAWITLYTIKDKKFIEASRKFLQLIYFSNCTFYYSFSLVYFGDYGCKTTLLWTEWHNLLTMEYMTIFLIFIYGGYISNLSYVSMNSNFNLVCQIFCSSLKYTFVVVLNFPDIIFQASIFWYGHDLQNSLR